MSGKIRIQTVSTLLKEAAKRLKPKKITCIADQEQGWLEAELLMAHVLKKDRTWIITHDTDFLTPSLEKRFMTLVERRLTAEPIAYIIGTKAFYGRDFFVNRTVLIPRPETELMIDTLKERRQKNDAFTVWDVGTGSGAIAITTALEFPHATVIASDICKRALKTAQKNAKLHHVEKRMAFIQANLLSPDVKRKIKSKHETPLVILANLPYLPTSDETELAKDVTAFEPAKALYAGDDGLDLIQKLFTSITEDLDVNPKLILTEFDPPQAKTILKLAKDTFPLATIRIHKDLAKRDRLIEIAF